MKDQSYLRLGSICALLLSVCYFAVVILALFSPKSVITYKASAEYFAQFAGYKDMFIALKVLLLVANMALVGVIIGVYAVYKHRVGGWFVFVSVLAVLGLGIGMYQSVVDATQVPHLSGVYQLASHQVRQVIIAFGVANPAIYALSLGLPGIWFIFMSLALRKLLPKKLVVSGLGWGLGSLLVVIAHLFVLVDLIYVVEAGALFAVPIWGTLQTLFFYKASKVI